MQHRKVKIEACKDPSDPNYGGWDVLIGMHDGTSLCVGETSTYDDAELIATAVEKTVNAVDKEFSNMF